MKKANFLTPVVTAFDMEGNLDIQANKNIFDHLINGGVDGLVIMGSTGEFFTMTTAQKKELIDLAVGYVDKRTKVYIGTSCMSVEDTVELSNYAIEAGADAVMIISPYYFTLSDASIEFFYDEIAKQVKGDIYLYNFPARTAHDLSPEVTLRLLRKHKNIVGFKDTVTEMGHTRNLITTVQDEFPDFVVLSGFDENFAHNILSGGSGCIGGLSNLYPEVFAEWVKAMDARDIEKVSAIQKIVDKMMDLYSVGTPFIPIIKKAMMIRGVEMQDYCTKPFITANEEQTKAIKAIMKEIEEKMLVAAN
ncbi:dihydrodipicolinate synthase/N-acetylneuraminate lyase [Clostridium aceticum]|uniref:Dihydrodipicolinate synthase/N-acetylneuraminate lyase n=1 Tax=Clostridium aceticum TaxID=84022 RepID=A0A0D8IC66_9CLOT|nr:dihydrodipicolinate synthase family protein [Clostridium aceticum]AKL94943.1 dihydrodipicolinate synthase/N-acetylneuraminate lyase [Clostridium aceticum]KJF27858.1 dihydrodipicolinate synthase [Clostridium aceticum]